MPTCRPEDMKYFKKYLESEHFLDWCKNIGIPDDETIYDIIPFYEKYCAKTKLKVKKEREIKFHFITIQDFQRRTDDIDKLLIFIKNINYLYSDGYWIIEQGKSVNIHIHMLVKIIDPSRHKKKLNIEWVKLFDTKLYDKDYYKLQSCNGGKGMVPYDQWVNEKLTYFVNEQKGDHSNSIDLGLSGRFG